MTTIMTSEQQAANTTPIQCCPLKIVEGPDSLAGTYQYDESTTTGQSVNIPQECMDSCVYKRVGSSDSAGIYCFKTEGAYHSVECQETGVTGISQTGGGQETGPVSGSSVPGQSKTQGIDGSSQSPPQSQGPDQSLSQGPEKSSTEPLTTTGIVGSSQNPPQTQGPEQSSSQGPDQSSSQGTEQSSTGPSTTTGNACNYPILDDMTTTIDIPDNVNTPFKVKITFDAVTTIEKCDPESACVTLLCDQEICDITYLPLNGRPPLQLTGIRKESGPQDLPKIVSVSINNEKQC